MTTREYAQTIELLDAPRHRRTTVVGPRHGGAGALGKARAMAGRAPRAAALREARAGSTSRSRTRSHELPLVARSLGIPSAYAFDYEFARVAARARLPRGDGASSFRRRSRRIASTDSARGASKVRRYPGLKEEYYLHGFEPDASVLDELGLDRERVLVVVRTPPEVSLYHRHGNPLFADVLERLGRDPSVQAVVLPRTDEQRARDRGARASVARRARARGRRAEPRRALRPRRLGGRDDEPRGGRARRARLHDVRGRLGAVDELLIARRPAPRRSRPRTRLELDEAAAVASQRRRLATPRSCST